MKEELFTLEATQLHPTKRPSLESIKAEIISTFLKEYLIDFQEEYLQEDLETDLNKIVTDKDDAYTLAKKLETKYKISYQEVEELDTLVINLQKKRFFLEKNWITKFKIQPKFALNARVEQGVIKAYSTVMPGYYVVENSLETLFIPYEIIDAEKV